MKKYYFIALAALSIVLVYCNPSKKVAGASDMPKSTFAANLSPVLMNNCSPCHYPAKGGNKKPFDNLANVKTEIDEMIRRIELTPAEKGFMPFKKTKLNDSTIAVFKQWRADGMME